MSKTLKNNLFLSSALPVAMLVAMPAQAQEGEAGEAAGENAQTGLGSIVVTARKRDETLTNAPVAVSAVGGEAINDQGVTNLEQISAQVPGLQIGRAAQTSNIFIRGVGSGINKGFEQSVGLYVDGIYQPRSRQFTAAIFDLQQVEVLRGPQGILFGKNTVAGAIKIETAEPRPGEDLNGSFSVAWEPEFNAQRYSAIVSTGIGNDAGLRLAVRYTASDGYVYNDLFDTDVAEREDFIGRATFVVEPAPNLTVTARATYLDMEATGKEAVIYAISSDLPPPNTLALSAAADPDFRVSAGDDSYRSFVGNPHIVPQNDREDVESFSASLELEWETGPLTITSVTGYSNFSFLQDHDVDFLPVSFIQNLDEEELDAFSQELRVSTDFDGPVNFIGGVYYEQQDMDLYAVTGFNGDFGVLPASILPGGIVQPSQATTFAQESEAIALFGELSFAVTDTLTLELGGRYSHDEKDVYKRVSVGTGIAGNHVSLVQPEDTIGSADFPTYLANAAAAGGADGANASATFGGLLTRFAHILDDSRSENHFDPSVRLRWEYHPDGSMYASYSEGYKSGGYNFGPESADFAGNPLPGHEFEDERVQAWEFGIKHEFGNTARAGLIFFRSDIDNLQVTSWNGSSFVVGNAASLRVQGIELDGQAFIGDGFEIGGSLAYLDNEFRSFPGAGCSVIQLNLATCPNTAGPGTQDLAGQSGAFAPEWSGNAYIDYSDDFGDFLLNARVGVNFKSGLYLDGDLDPNAYQSGYAKIDAHLGVEIDNFELRVFGRNLTDQATYTASIDAPLSPGVYVGWIEEPRTIGLEARFNF